MSTGLSASLEDYLEAIYQELREKPVARAKGLSERLSVTQASVTGALRQLAERGLINYAPYGLITLTSAGDELARDVCERHALLLEFFSRVLGSPHDEAEKAACRLEHALPPEIQGRLLAFVRFLDICPRRCGPHWHERFQEFQQRGQLPDSCRSCQARGLVAATGATAP